MPYVVTDPCAGNKDLTCIDVCPVDCIYDGGDDDKIVYIKVDECIACGACRHACPVEAIVMIHDADGAEETVFTPIAAQWFDDREGARERLVEILSQRSDA
jgi:NAD-dependent dihydropyrimidine dehydrogenase PreA subunit